MYYGLYRHFPLKHVVMEVADNIEVVDSDFLECFVANGWIDDKEWSTIGMAFNLGLDLFNVVVVNVGITGANYEFLWRHTGECGEDMSQGRVAHNIEGEAEECIDGALIHVT